MQPAILIDYHRKIILLGILLISLIAITLLNVGFNWVSCVSIVSFISFITILYRNLNYEEDYYTSSRLFLTVTIYSLIMVALYWWLSWYIDGDTYLFSKKDALLYERVSMKIKDWSYAEGLLYLKNNYRFDDWGAMVMMSSILRIIPHKIFLNFCYVLMGGLTAIMLFRTGKRIMSKQCAYLAAAAYSISSYNIFYYGSFLKEVGFILLIVLLFNSLYKYIIEGNNFSILYVIVYSALICFFRPATTVFIWFGIGMYYLFRHGQHIGKIAMISLIGITILYMMSSLQEIFNHYTLRGDIRFLLSTKESTGLSTGATYAINFFASFFGPFPTLIDTKNHITCLYGSGLLYKFFINLPFVMGAWKIIRDKIVDLYPLLFFILMEALSVAVVQKGFELRLTLPHLAFVYMIAFWYFSEAEEKEEKRFNRLSPLFYVLLFAIVFTWGVFRR